MDKTIIKEDVSKRLGFQKMETAEIVKALNDTLCTYQIFFHKLQSFHWNVVGSDFLDVHDITQEMYEKGLKEIDDIAERIRVFGQNPEVKITEYLRHSLIEETSHEKSAEYMMYEIISDIEKLTENLLDVHGKASENGDVGTVYMCNHMIKDLETHHWKLSAWTSRKFE